MMTPEEIRAKALELAVAYWAGTDPTSYKVPLATAAEFEAYLTGPKTGRMVCPPVPDTVKAYVSGVHPRARTVPIPDTAGFLTDTAGQEVREHVDHDGDWGPMCRGCSHSKGVHKFGGCHFVEADMSYCECEGYRSVSGVSVTDTTCTCTHPKSTHDADGCKSATGCECTWSPA